MENDRRTRRTKKLLTDAFIELLFSKKLNEITVKELCDKADLSKSQWERELCKTLGEVLSGEGNK